MTTSGRSSAAILPLQRRSLLLGGLGGAAALTLGSSAKATAAESAGTPQIDFDLDSDNFIEWLQPTDDKAGVSPSADVFAPMDVTMFVYINHLTAVAWFDAVAPYHDSAVGVFTRLGRRPSGESATNRNMNIALLHATYQIVKAVLPVRVPTVRTIMGALGLNPDDDSSNPADPAGIGNLAGKGVIAARRHDGMNMLGDEGGRVYNLQPYADYTGYRPVNTPYQLINPSRWQPQITPHRRRLGAGAGDMGIYTAQTFVTPQIRKVKPYSFTDPGTFRLAAPTHIDHTRPRAYKASVDDILQVSANLTDEQKIMAEVFDNKVWGIGHSTIVLARHHDRELGVQGWAHFFLVHLLSTFEPLIAAWHQKIKYDAIRPQSAVRYLYGNRKVTAWGGPGKGRVTDIPADQWMPYLNTSDHSEYPSGSTTLCSAEAQAARRYFGSDDLEWKFTVKAGSTLVEPGITPAKDTELYWPTWTDFVKDCAMSRVWGGVHFRKTVQQSVVFGEQFGDLAYEFVMRHVNGEVRD